VVAGPAQDVYLLILSRLGLWVLETTPFLEESKMKRKMNEVLRVASGLVIFMLLMPVQASPEVFPEDGRVIRFIVPNPPGGGMDLYPRTLAPFLKKYLPWKKGEIVVENVVGAGGFTGTREIFFSKPDGYTIGIIMMRVALIPQIMGQVAKFDSSQFTFLGQFNNFPLVVFTNGRHPFLRSFSDFKNPARPLTFGMDIASVPTYWLFKEKMRLNVKAILGYQGAPQVRLALLKGEIDFESTEFSSIASLVKAGDLKLLFHLGDKPLDVAAGFPSIIDLGYDQEFAGKISTDRNIVGPPEIPKDRVEILEKAIWQALNDPQYIELSQKAGRILNVQNGENTRKICIDNVKFWSKYGDDIKDEMKKIGYR